MRITAIYSINEIQLPYGYETDKGFIPINQLVKEALADDGYTSDFITFEYQGEECCMPLICKDDKPIQIFLPLQQLEDDKNTEEEQQNFKNMLDENSVMRFVARFKLEDCNIVDSSTGDSYSINPIQTESSTGQNLDTQTNQDTGDMAAVEKSEEITEDSIEENVPEVKDQNINCSEEGFEVDKTSTKAAESDAEEVSTNISSDTETTVEVEAEEQELTDDEDNSREASESNTEKDIEETDTIEGTDDIEAENISDVANDEVKAEESQHDTDEIEKQKLEELENTLHALTDVTPDDAQNQIRRMQEDKSVTYFVPTVTFDPQYAIPGLTKDIIDCIYNIGVDNYQDECANPQLKHFIALICQHFTAPNRNPLPLKVITDCLSIDVFTRALKIKIEQVSPNGLYEHMYYTTYLIYHTLLSDPEYDNNLLPYDLTDNLIRISTLAESSVIIDDGDYSTDENGDEVFQEDTYLTIITSLRNTANESASDFIRKCLHGTKHYDQNGNLIEGLDLIKYLCLSGAYGNYIPINSKFLKDSSLGEIQLLVKETGVEFKKDTVPLSPHAIGLFYNAYRDNCKQYQHEHLDDAHEVVPYEAAFKDISYNGILKKIQASAEFTKVYNVQLFTPLCATEELKLHLCEVIYGKYNGQVINRPLGFLCINTQEVNPKRKAVFLPAAGKYLQNKEAVILDKPLSLKPCKLQSITDPSVVIETCYPVQVSQLIKQYGIAYSVLDATPYTKDELLNFSLNTLVDKVRRCKHDRNILTPYAVLADTQSIEEFFRYNFHVKLSK